MVFAIAFAWVESAVVVYLREIYFDGGFGFPLVIKWEYEIRWSWYDLAVELSCAGIMIVAFCWDWKYILQIPGEIIRSGLPNPFAWWLYLPGYIFSIVYFTVKLRQSIIRYPTKNELNYRVSRIRVVNLDSNVVAGTHSWWITAPFA